MSTPEKETHEHVVVDVNGGHLWEKDGKIAMTYFTGELAANYPVGTRVTVTIQRPAEPELDLPSEEELKEVERGFCGAATVKRVVVAYRTLREKARAVVSRVRETNGCCPKHLADDLAAALGEGRE